jgi:hypothetical protein
VNMIYLLLHFLVLRVMIRYHIMTPLSHLSSLIVVFCLHGMHDSTTYDTPIVTSLTRRQLDCIYHRRLLNCQSNETLFSSLS